MTVPAREFLQITRPHEITPDLRTQLVGCWTTVVNAGGAVIAPGIPLPPVSVRDVGPAAERLIDGLDPERARLLVATMDGHDQGRRVWKLPRLGTDLGDPAPAGPQSRLARLEQEVSSVRGGGGPVRPDGVSYVTHCQNFSWEH